MANPDFEFDYYEIPATQDLLLSAKGNNKKKVLVLTESHLDGPQHSLLKKILSAVDHDLDEDCLLKTLEPGYQYPLRDHLESGEVQKVLAFGISPESLGTQLSPSLYRLIQIEETRLVFASPLARIAENKEEKQALWAQMKHLFSPAT